MIFNKNNKNNNCDLISIVVPAFNVEDYLPECISSLVNQTYSNLEIILVDDGSQDRSSEICDEWKNKDQRIQVIHQKNIGLSGARNTGTKIACGKYLTYIDADDWISANYIEELYSLITSTDTMKIAACQYIKVCDQKELEKLNLNLTDNKIFKISATEYQSCEDLAALVGTVVWNKMYLTELVKQFEFPLGRLHEDEFYTYKLIDQAEGAIVTTNILYFYRQREGSIVNNPINGYLDALDARLEKIQYFQVHYPNLVFKEKLIFLELIRYFKRMSRSTDVTTGKQIRKNLLLKLKCVNLSVNEIKKLKLKELAKMFLIIPSLLMWNETENEK